MTYKELQTALRQFKVEGLTDVKLNSSQETLQSEYDQVIERLEINKMMIELEGSTTKEVLEMIEDIEDTLETYEDIRQQTKDDLTAVDRYIEIIEKTLSVKFHCDYRINRLKIIENKDVTVKEFLSGIAKDAGIYTTDLLFAVEISIENDLSYPEYKLGALRHNSLNSFLEHFAVYLLETENQLEETTPSVLEIVTSENDSSLDTATCNDEETIAIEVIRFIEIVEKTLTVNFCCDYKINRSMILENKERTVKEITAIIARKADVNTIDFLLALEENVEDLGFDLTDYRYDPLSYFLENLETEQLLEEKTPSVLEIVTPENDPSLDTATQYYVDAINHVFKEFGSNNFITKGYLRLSVVNNVTVNDFIKFLNLNSGISFREFMDCLGYHLISEYQFTSPYSYSKYSLKLFLQDFATHLDDHKLVA
jgi:hypothetical protein